MMSISTLRSGEVVGDVIMERDYFQLRTYSMDDVNREDGAKQNVQLTKEMAKEVKILFRSIH